MKIIILLSFIILSNMMFAQSKSQKVIIKTFTYCDHCKECESCAGKMKTELSYIKGIKSIEFNEKDTTIIVKYNSKKITVDKIKVEITKLGFAADDLPADPSAYDKLDNCCKKKD